MDGIFHTSDVRARMAAAKLFTQAAALILGTFSPLSAADWGDFQKDQCLRAGIRQYSSRLWNISGSWEQACASTPATVAGQAFARPTRCVNKGVFGMWGEFDVSDDSCPHWGEPFQRDDCTRMGVRQYSARLWDVPADTTWEAACAAKSANVLGQSFAAPTRCVNKGAFGMWGEFDVADSSCPNWGAPFQRDACRGSGLRQFSARLWDMPPGVTWEAACAGTSATVEGQFFATPTRCVNKGAFGMWGEFDVPDATCNRPYWGTTQDDGCTHYGTRQYSARLWDTGTLSWEAACAATGATVAGQVLPAPTRCVNKGAFGMWGEFDVADASCGGGSSRHPFRGSLGWSVLLCTFTDSGPPPRDAEFYRDMILRPGRGGLADYWAAVSGNGVNLNGSVVQGWYTEPRPILVARARSRDEKFQDCIDAAQNSSTSPYRVPAGHLTAVITFPDLDLFGMPGRGSFLPASVGLAGMAHETGHGMDLVHSFSDDPTYRNAPWAQIGEYDDPWDMMSYANVFSRKADPFGYGGPGMNSYHLDRMGWLPRSRILTLGADGVGRRTVTLAALTHAEAAGFLHVRIPFDPADLFHYYTVEFRRNDGWDTGIPNDVVLIHEVKPDPDGVYHAYLLRARDATKAPIQSLDKNGATITVDTVSAATNQATVTVSSSITSRCLQGYVWREANASDHVCVTGETRRQAREDNVQAAVRRVPGGGDACLSGFVWREATAADHVCVSGQVRQQVREDNLAASSRTNPARLLYGPNTCKEGYVWREADEKDWLCVSPQVREQVRDDNAQAVARRVSPSDDTCLQGFVWREAFPGDHVCVTGQTRAQALSDNSQATSRLLKP